MLDATIVPLPTATSVADPSCSTPSAAPPSATFKRAWPTWITGRPGFRCCGCLARCGACFAVPATHNLHQGFIGAWLSSCSRLSSSLGSSRVAFGRARFFKRWSETVNSEKRAGPNAAYLTTEGACCNKVGSKRPPRAVPRPPAQPTRRPVLGMSPSWRNTLHDLGRRPGDQELLPRLLKVRPGDACRQAMARPRGGCRAAHCVSSAQPTSPRPPALPHRALKGSAAESPSGPGKVATTAPRLVPRACAQTLGTVTFASRAQRERCGGRLSPRATWGAGVPPSRARTSPSLVRPLHPPQGRTGSTLAATCSVQCIEPRYILELPTARGRRVRGRRCPSRASAPGPARRQLNAIGLHLPVGAAANSDGAGSSYGKAAARTATTGAPAESRSRPPWRVGVAQATRPGLAHMQAPCCATNRPPLRTSVQTGRSLRIPADHCGAARAEPSQSLPCLHSHARTPNT